jgi:hypothetical protein
MLTPEQMEEAVEAAMEATHHAMPFEYMATALTAALPVIERAVLGKAAEAAERHEFRAEYAPDAIAADIRALAGEVR